MKMIIFKLTFKKKINLNDLSEQIKNIQTKKYF